MRARAYALWGAVAFVAVPQAVIADAYSPAAGFYDAATGLFGAALDKALHDLTKGQTVRTYDQLRQDLAVTDRDWTYPPSVSNPTGVTNILLMYSFGWSGYSRSGVWDGGVTWNREHTWPDSRGVGQPDTGPDFSDLHHLRAANPSANTSRSNNWYDEGGSLGPVSSAPNARLTANTWEPPDVDKGWVARAILYMATRYDGSEANTTDLVLVETPPSSTTGNPPQMGRLSTLLRWNRLYPPGEWERRRNQIVFAQFQGNRNPFIDHPDFADAIYEQPAGKETRAIWRLRHFTLAELESESVAGDLADPDGDGAPNLLEYAIGANPRVSDAAVAPVILREPSRLLLQFSRQRDRALDGLSYSVETAVTLSGLWQTVTSGTETVASTTGSIERVSLVLPSGGSTVFARLRVTR